MLEEANSQQIRTLPKLYLARHGETAWRISGQHTGRADIPVTDLGERNARSLRARLNGLSFVKVLVGSSNFKFGLFDVSGQETMSSGMIEMSAPLASNAA